LARQPRHLRAEKRQINHALYELSDELKRLHRKYAEARLNRNVADEDETSTAMLKAKYNGAVSCRDVLGVAVLLGLRPDALRFHSPTNETAIPAQVTRALFVPFLVARLAETAERSLSVGMMTGELLLHDPQTLEQFVGLRKNVDSMREGGMTDANIVAHLHDAVNQVMGGASDADVEAGGDPEATAGDNTEGSSAR